MKNKNHNNKKPTQKTEVKNSSFLESLKKGCSVIGEKMREKARHLPDFILKNSFAILFFTVVWTLLAFYEDALLFRINELSLFLYDDLYYEEMMSVPAGFLSYIACYLVQFFYYPLLGATIYVGLLVLVYWLTCKVFDISHRYRLLAMVPVIALLASNTQLGYWIFYLKLPGYYYVALLGVVVSLLATWVVKKSHIYIKPLLVAAWMYFVYPYFGIYAIVSGIIMGVHSLCLAIGRKYNVQKIVISSASMVVSVVMYNIVPGVYYTDYTTVPSEEMLTVGLPASQWKSEHVPSVSEKEAVVSFVTDISGKVGYPTGKELNKFKTNVDAAFSEKAIKSAMDGLYSSEDINKLVDGKKYTFTFVGKDGREYYLDYVNGEVSFVPRNGRIPQSGFFLCDVDSLAFTSFKTLDGKYLSWNSELPSDSMQVNDATELSSDSLSVPFDAELSSDSLAVSGDVELPSENQLSLLERDGNSVPISVGLVASIKDGNTRCLVEKLRKEEGVNVDENSKLFGFVNLFVFGKDIDFKGFFQPSFVVGFGDGELKGCKKAFFNNSLSTALRIEEVGFVPAPISLEMTKKSMWYDMNTYWIPFWLLLVAFLVLAVVPAIPLRLPEYSAEYKWMGHLIPGFVALYLVAFSYLFWYKNCNFHIENEQNKAMWEEDWERVAKLAKETDEPTRQVVMNKNIALLRLGKSGSEQFAYPDGCADIEAPVHVRLAQTGGKMAYYQYGKFNFCYRWCVEDAVEYGWRVEYLKHAVRSMILSGEYKLAKRYIKILKRTKYYADWASEMERYINDTALIKKQKAFEMPLEMACYDDQLDVDESFVEAYLTKNLTNIPKGVTRTYMNAAFSSVLTRKDLKQFCLLLKYYIETYKAKRLPSHYQEAAMLFYELEKVHHNKLSREEWLFLESVVGKYVSAKARSNMKRFMARVTEYKGMDEAEMAPYFKDDFGSTYYYFYFFVRNIKTN